MTARQRGSAECSWTRTVRLTWRLWLEVGDTGAWANMRGARKPAAEARAGATRTFLMRRRAAGVLPVFPADRGTRGRRKHRRCRCSLRRTTASGRGSRGSSISRTAPARSPSAPATTPARCAGRRSTSPPRRCSTSTPTTWSAATPPRAWPASATAPATGTSRWTATCPSPSARTCAPTTASSPR